MRLYNKLRTLDPSVLEISGYGKWYLRVHLENIRAVIERYSYLLLLCLEPYGNVDIGSFKFLDYGGGIGIMSLLAKEIGIGTVIYNDINDVICKDAQQIAKLIENEADFYINGDIDDTVTYLKDNKIYVHAAASYDVIEHIYDINYYFRKLPEVSTGKLVIVMASAANSYNILVKKNLMRHHINSETKDREKRFEEDDPRSFQSMRREIISDYARQNDLKLSHPELETLVLNTRGFRTQEICLSVADYVTAGKLPQPPDHPTNTCDPHDSGWEDQLLDHYRLNELIDIVCKNGFKANLIAGFYYSKKTDSPQRKLIKFFMNKIIYLTKFLSARSHLSLRISPFFIIYGIRE